MTRAERRVLLERIRAALPPVPPEDARCHLGICQQHECVFCARLLNAYNAIDKLEEDLEDARR